MLRTVNYMKNVLGKSELSGSSASRSQEQRRRWRGAAGEGKIQKCTQEEVLTKDAEMFFIIPLL